MGEFIYLRNEGSFQVVIVLPHTCVEEITRAVDELLGGAGVTKKHQKNIFEYWYFSQKSYLNMGRLENNIFAYLKFNICIPKI